jgi:hypothetical protein
MDTDSRYERIDRDVPGRARIGGGVKAVSVISTGTVRIHPEQLYGTRKPLYWRRRPATRSGCPFSRPGPADGQ